jgi:O-antigen/teichoic acid export membrane protein
MRALDALNFLRKSSLARDLSHVASGAALAQAITFVATPAIARLYGPAAFGELSIFLSLANVALPLFTLTYPTAILLPRSTRMAALVSRAALAVCAAAAVLALVSASIITIFPAAHWERLPIDPGSILAVTLFSVLAAERDLLTQWVARNNRFQALGGASVLQSLFSNGVKLAIPSSLANGAVLITVAIVGLGAHVAILLMSAGASARQSFLVAHTLRCHWREIARVAIRYSDFPLYRAPKVFLDALAGGLPILYLSYSTGPQSAGLYSVALTLLALPISVVGASMDTAVSRRIAAAAHQNEPVWPIIGRTGLALAALSLAPFLIVFAIPDPVFRIVFGADWVEAGAYARGITPWLFLSLIIRPFASAVGILGLNKAFMKIDLATLFASALALYVGMEFFSNDVSAIALYGLVNSCARITFACVVRRAAMEFDAARALS